jgi:hypothetical protein
MESIFNLPVRAPDYIVFGSEETAPAAATTMAQTPALSGVLNGYLIVAIKIASDDAVPAFELVIRNAANSADVSVLLISAAETPGFLAFWFPAANGQTVLARIKSSGTSAKNYQCALNVWRY